MMNVDYVNYSFSDIIAKFKEYLARETSFTNIMDTGDVEMLSNFIAYVGSLGAYKVNFNAKEAFYDYLSKPSSLISYTHSFGFNPPRKKSAVATAFFYLNTPNAFDIQIPRYYKVKSKSGKIYLTRDLTTIPAGSLSASVNLIQGEFVTIDFEVTPDVVDEGYLIDDINVENDNIFVKVNNQEYTWVERLVEAKHGDYVFQDETTLDNKTLITFGDIRYGTQIKVGDLVEIKYLKTIGSEGNIAVIGAINVMTDPIYDVASNLVTVNVRSTTASLGGNDFLSLDDCKYLAPRVWQMFDRVSRDVDYMIKAEEHQSVLQAFAWGERKSNPPNINMANVIKLVVCIAGGLTEKISYDKIFNSDIDNTRTYTVLQKYRRMLITPQGSTTSKIDWNYDDYNILDYYNAKPFVLATSYKLEDDSARNIITIDDVSSISGNTVKTLNFFSQDLPPAYTERKDFVFSYMLPYQYKHSTKDGKFLSSSVFYCESMNIVSEDIKLGDLLITQNSNDSYGISVREIIDFTKDSFRLEVVPTDADASYGRTEGTGLSFVVIRPVPGSFSWEFLNDSALDAKISNYPNNLYYYVIHGEHCYTLDLSKSLGMYNRHWSSYIDTTKRYPMFLVAYTMFTTQGLITIETPISTMLTGSFKPATSSVTDASQKRYLTVGPDLAPAIQDEILSYIEASQDGDTRIIFDSATYVPVEVFVDAYVNSLSDRKKVQSDIEAALLDNFGYGKLGFGVNLRYNDLISVIKNSNSNISQHKTELWVRSNAKWEATNGRKQVFKWVDLQPNVNPDTLFGVVNDSLTAEQISSGELTDFDSKGIVQVTLAKELSVGDTIYLRYRLADKDVVVSNHQSCVLTKYSVRVFIEG